MRPSPRSWKFTVKSFAVITVLILAAQLVCPLLVTADEGGGIVLPPPRVCAEAPPDTNAVDTVSTLTAEQPQSASFLDIIMEIIDVLL